MQYGNVTKFNGLRGEIEKTIKKVYMWDVISAFLNRVCSVENHNGELIFDEHT